MTQNTFPKSFAEVLSAHPEHARSVSCAHCKHLLPVWGLYFHSHLMVSFLTEDILNVNDVQLTNQLNCF